MVNWGWFITADLPLDLPLHRETMMQCVGKRFQPDCFSSHQNEPTVCGSMTLGRQQRYISTWSCPLVASDFFDLPVWGWWTMHKIYVHSHGMGRAIFITIRPTEFTIRRSSMTRYDHKVFILWITNAVTINDITTIVYYSHSWWAKGFTSAES